MGFLDNKDKSKCSGCAACAQICPKNSIQMIQDEEGFLYPCINEDLCIKCNICRKICPEDNKITFYEPISSFAAVCKQEDKLLLSASGGAFYAITIACDSETEIFGAAWIERSRVHHKGVNATGAYDIFRKSKYVQSEIGRTYIQVKEALTSGRKVIFTGTPCEIAGLRAYLNKDYPDLTLVDLICHGVASSKALEKCLMCFDKKKDAVNNITFRHKEKQNKKWKSKLVKLEFNSGKKKILDYNMCGFLRGYDNGLMFRPSCAKCQFARSQRISDLTIGDFGGGEDYGYDTHHGASLILVNTEKGQKLCNMISNHMHMEKINYDFAVKHNARLKSPDKGNKRRTEFYKRIETEPFESVIQSIVPKIPKWKKLAHKIKFIVRSPANKSQALK